MIMNGREIKLPQNDKQREERLWRRRERERERQQSEAAEQQEDRLARRQRKVLDREEILQRRTETRIAEVQTRMNTAL